MDAALHPYTLPDEAELHEGGVTAIGGLLVAVTQSPSSSILRWSKEKGPELKIEPLHVVFKDYADFTKGLDSEECYKVLEPVWSDQFCTGGCHIAPIDDAIFINKNQGMPPMTYDAIFEPNYANARHDGNRNLRTEYIAALAEYKAAVARGDTTVKKPSKPIYAIPGRYLALVPDIPRYTQRYCIPVSNTLVRTRFLEGGKEYTPSELCTEKSMLEWSNMNLKSAVGKAMRMTPEAIFIPSFATNNGYVIVDVTGDSDALRAALAGDQWLFYACPITLLESPVPMTASSEDPIKNLEPRSTAIKTTERGDKFVTDAIMKKVSPYIDPPPEGESRPDDREKILVRYNALMAATQTLPGETPEAKKRRVVIMLHSVWLYEAPKNDKDKEFGIIPFKLPHFVFIAIPRAYKPLDVTKIRAALVSSSPVIDNGGGKKRAREGDDGEDGEDEGVAEHHAGHDHSVDGADANDGVAKLDLDKDYEKDGEDDDDQPPPPPPPKAKAKEREPKRRRKGEED
jgi:hypothetical protein